MMGPAEGTPFLPAPVGESNALQTKNSVGRLLCSSRLSWEQIRRGVPNRKVVVALTPKAIRDSCGLVGIDGMLEAVCPMRDYEDCFLFGSPARFGPCWKTTGDQNERDRLRWYVHCVHEWAAARRCRSSADFFGPKSAGTCHPAAEGIHYSSLLPPPSRLNAFGWSSRMHQSLSGSRYPCGPGFLCGTVRSMLPP